MLFISNKMNMKIKTLTFFIILTLVTSLKLFAQFQITDVYVSSGGVLVHNIYNVADPLPQNCTTAPNPNWTYITIEAKTNVSFNGEDFTYDHVDSDITDPSLTTTTHLYFRIDPLQKMIDTFSATTKSHSYSLVPYQIWNTGNIVQFNNAGYVTSKDGDSIIVSLKGQQMKNIGLLEADYEECIGSGRIGYRVFIGSEIDTIPESASLSVIITGKFPLSVSYAQNKFTFIIDQVSKTLKLSQLIKNQALSCFDLLGRKHDLEFLGADNTSATYSVRSLRPGVYFVNDGRETMKFMIGE
jgi:hypothetical protein